MTAILETCKIFFISGVTAKKGIILVQKTHKVHSVVPIYLVGVVWAVGTVFFNVCRLTGYVRLTLLSVLVYLLAYAVFPTKTVTEEAPEPEQKAEPVDPERSALEQERDRALAELRRLNDAIPDEKRTKQLDHIAATTKKVFSYVMDHPEKKEHIRRFQDFYLPTTIKLLHSYNRMDHLGVSGENIDASKQKIADLLSTVEQAYDRQLDVLCRDEAMDISAEVTVLKQLMAQEGLTESEIQR